MVAAVIGALVIAGITTGLQNFLKGEKGARNSLDFDLFRHSVFVGLSRVDTCAELFRETGGATKLQVPASFGPGALVAVPVLKMGSSTLLDMASPSIASGLVVSKAQLEGLSAGTNEVVGGITYRNYLAQLIIEANKQGDAFGRKNFSASFPLTLRVNPLDSNRIATCNGTGTEGLNPSPSPSPGEETAEEGWPNKMMLCAPGLLMLGAGPGGPICGVSGQDHLGYRQALPPGSTPVSCVAARGTKTRNYACTAKKASCTFVPASGSNPGGWQYTKGGKTIECTKGMNVETPDPGAISVGSTDLISSDLFKSIDQYEVSCVTSNATGAGAVCGAVDNSAKTSLGSAETSDCVFLNGKWSMVTAPKKAGDDGNAEECKKGLLLQPL